MLVGVGDRLGAGLHVRHSVVALLQLLVLRDQRVQADALGSLAGPCEAPTRTAADVQQALALVERVVQPEVVDEDAPVQMRARLERTLLVTALTPVSELGVTLGIAASKEPSHGREV